MIIFSFDRVASPSCLAAWGGGRGGAGKGGGSGGGGVGWSGRVVMGGGFGG